MNNHCKTKKAGASSQYFGVCYVEKKKKWVSEIRKDKVRHHVGSFKTEIEAAKAYNKKAFELYGEDAKINVIS